MYSNHWARGLAIQLQWPLSNNEEFWLEINLIEITKLGFLQPQSNKNIISVAKLLKDGYQVEFDKNSCKIMKETQQVGFAVQRKGIYVITNDREELNSMAMVPHYRLGHASSKI